MQNVHLLCVCSPEFDDCDSVLKSMSTNEVVLQETRSATLLPPSHESTALLLPPVFNTQLSNSGLHTFALRLPCLLPTSERGRIGVNYSIFIYFCSHRSLICYHWVDQIQDNFSLLGTSAWCHHLSVCVWACEAFKVFLSSSAPSLSSPKVKDPWI